MKLKFTATGAKDEMIVENISYIVMSEYNKQLEFSGITTYGGEMVVKLPLKKIKEINVEVTNDNSV